MIKYRNWISSSVVLLLFFSMGAFVAPAFAAGTTAKPAPKQQDISQSITQSYNADSSVQIGMVVKLKDKDANTVEPLIDDNVNHIFGVVVPADSSSVTLTPENIKKQQVFVATQGTVQMLVSNQNGVIRAGNFITISAIGGVGMLADETNSTIVGKAVGNFNGTNNVIGTVNLKEKNGKERPVSISRIYVSLIVGHNPLQTHTSDYLPGFISKAASGVANKPVSAARTYLGLVVLIVSAAVTGTIVYSGVRSGMLSIGRNPLSKKSIVKSLVQTIASGLIIFIVGVFAVYLLLKL